MDRTPLKSIGNILPNCLTVSGQKKLIGPAQVSHLTQQLSKSDPSGAGVANGILKTQLPQTENSTGNRSRQNSESDRPGGSPGTPMKPSGQSGGSKPGTPPLTPLANLKVLIAAASTALEKEEQQGGGEGSGQEGAKVKEAGVKEDDGGGRKMKSLAILCKRFLSIAESEIGVGVDFSLESMSKKLGTNRRRIYDIINVLEALEMIVKQSKNWYTWLGQGNLLVTLAKMKAMAEDDVDFRAILNKENGCTSTSNRSDSQQNHPLPSSISETFSSVTSPSELSPSQPAALVAASSGSLHVEEAESGNGSSAALGKSQDEVFSLGGEELGGMVSGGRWDKSLGVLCQKFVMLFLVTPDNEVTLDYAGNVLMPDDSSFSVIPLSNPKTKVRRLYDIANVLTTLGLIRKKTFLAPNHRKMPGYSWAGPSLEEIKTISVFRKSETNLYPFYSKRRGAGGTSLTRKPSFGSVRPFLHQYEVKGEAGSSVGKSPSQPNSAPSSPVKSKESGFKRSLSFGAGPAKKQLPVVAANSVPMIPGGIGIMSRPQVATPSRARPSPVQQAPVATPTVSKSDASSTVAPGKCVVARQLPQQQVDYLQEMREFEAELLKNAHKFPNIAPFFHDFVVRFYNTLRQAASIKTTEQSPTSQFGVANLSTSMATTYADIVSPPSGPNSGSATPSSENMLPTTPILNLDHAFNPNSLLVTSPTSYTLIPTTSTASPSFFPFYASSLSPVAMMAAALSRSTTGAAVPSNATRPLAPKPAMAQEDNMVAQAAEAPGNPAKRAKLEAS